MLRGLELPKTKRLIFVVPFTDADRTYRGQSLETSSRNKAANLHDEDPLR